MVESIASECLCKTSNRVESLFTETPSHTTVQAMSHTAVLLLCLPKANERLKSPNLLNHSRFIALCTIWFKDLRHHPTDEHATDQASCWFIFIAVNIDLMEYLRLRCFILKHRIFLRIQASRPFIKFALLVFLK